MIFCSTINSTLEEIVSSIRAVSTPYENRFERITLMRGGSSINATACALYEDDPRLVSDNLSYESEAEFGRNVKSDCLGFQMLLASEWIILDR